MEHMQDIATQNPEKQKEMAKKLEEGKLSIRDWREQISNVMNMSVFIHSAASLPAHTIDAGGQYPRSPP